MNLNKIINDNNKFVIKKIISLRLLKNINKE